MHFNDIRVNKKRLYIRISGSLISYKFFNEMSFLDDNFTDIYMYFLNKFPSQFKHLNVINLKREGLSKLENRIASDVIRFDLNIQLRFDLMEFYDGIYSIKLHKFLRKDRIKRDNLLGYLGGLATIKYYDRHYKHLSFNTAWEKELKYVINDDIDSFEEIAIRVANIFHKSDDLVGKKKALYIWGESNTGKTSLIAKPVIAFFGKENIGYFSSSNKFKFEGLVDKNVAVIDEFIIAKNNKVLLQELKKLLNEEELLVDRKYRQATLLDKIPIFIISNYNLDDLDPIDYDALKNRIKTIQFSKKIKNKNFKIKKILDNEEASIIIKCNEIYYKTLGKKTRMSPVKILSYIQNDETNEITTNNKNLNKKLNQESEDEDYN